MGNISNEKVVLLKPQTYMNLSGNSLIQFKNFYKISNEEIIVIYDDVDLDVGDLRIRTKGSGGTHNGMKSVIENLKTEQFIRIRIGIGMPENKEDMINYVIGHIPKKEKEILDEATTKAKDAILEILKNGIDASMNKFN
jgi:PTH1 family peptidyl-tRNA hydrolase